LLGEFFENSRETVASIVYDDIDALELIDGGVECGVDIGFLSNVELQREVVL
jgi:hypothetical protein